MRVFAALPLPPAQVRELVELSGTLAGRCDRLRPVRPEAFHITLLFWAELAESGVRRLEALLDEPELCRRAPITASLGGLGRFPPRGTPRVIYRSVQEGSREISAFQALLARKVELLGGDFPLEKRRFTPHVTLARNRGGLLEPGGWETLAGPGQSFRIDRCLLIESRLRPQGPLYTVLKAVAFDGDA